MLDDTGAFEDPDNSSGSSQGNIPPGLSAGADTAITFPFSSDNVIGLNMALAAAQNYATKSEWLDFINNQANWTTSATGLPSGGVAFGLPCPGSTPPRMANPGAKTFTVGTLSSFQVVANDPGCYGVTLSAAGQPAGPSFTTAGNGTNTVGTFSWNPNLGDEGTYLVRFTATDSSTLASSLVIRVYVRSIGEATNSSGVPVSQTNWVVDITDAPANGASADITWEATIGIPYDVYYSDSDPSGGMVWVKYGTALADASSETMTVPESTKRYFAVVPAGESPTSYGLWGVIKPTVAANSYTMLSAPLDIADRSMGGELGNALKAVLSNGDKVFAMTAGGGWTTITLSRRELGYRLHVRGRRRLLRGTQRRRRDPALHRPGGQRRHGQPDHQRGGTSTSGRWNILGLSQGKTLNFSSAFSNFTGTPTANWNQNVADVIAIDQGGGVFKRYFRSGDGVWRDASNLSTSIVNPITPGKAVYYFHYGTGSLSINF